MTPLMKSRLTLIAVVLMFAIPLVAAFVLRSSDWRPTNTKNSGTIIDPPRDITGVEGVQSDGTRFAWKDAQYHWTLLMLPGATCMTACTERVEEAVRMRLTLGRNADRLRIVYIGPKKPDDFFASRAPLADVNDVNNAFAHEHAQGDDSLALALIDPQGLLMMRYPGGYSAQGLRSDITRIIY